MEDQKQTQPHKNEHPQEPAKSAQEQHSNHQHEEQKPQSEQQQTNQYNQTNQTDSEYFPDFQKPVQEELVFQWQAPSRAFKKRKRQYFTTIATIVLLLCLILFFAGQILPVAVVIAVAFLTYIMATIPPQTVTNSITTFGIRNEENLYYWEELGRFWFNKKYDDTILYVEVDRFPFRLSLLLGKESKEELAEILSEVLIQEKPPLTETEKLAAWLQEKIPLDIDS